MYSTDKNYRMPLWIKRALATELDPHARGHLKRLLIQANLAERTYRNRRRSTVEKDTGAE